MNDREHDLVGTLDLIGDAMGVSRTDGPETLIAKCQSSMAELSRLRELVKEMREAHINTLSIARIKWGNLDQDVNTIFEKAEQSIAKADAILGESGGKK